MPAVDIIINGTFFQVSCGSGEERHLNSLASELDERVRQFSSSPAGTGSDKLSLVMAALTFVDESRDAKNELAKVQEKLKKLKASVGDTNQESIEKELLPIIDSLTDRVDTLIAKINKNKG